MVIGKGKEKANPLRCGKYWDSCTAHCTLNNILKSMSPVSYSDTANYATQEQTRNRDLIDYYFDLKCNSFGMSRIFPLSCYEKNDILRYIDFEQHCFQATPVILQSTFDYYMLGVTYKPAPICNYICQDTLAWENASEYFKSNMLTILDPVNPSEFLKNPRYGPFVFCNIKHAGVKDVLDMIDVNAKEFNICRDRSKPIKLFQRVHKEIYDSIVKTSESLERCFMIPVDRYGSSES